MADLEYFTPSCPALCWASTSYFLKRKVRRGWPGASPAMTRKYLVFEPSTGPQHLGPVADHLRLLRQRHRWRHQDHQRLGAEDRGSEIEAYFRAIEPADDGAERGAE